MLSLPNISITGNGVLRYDDAKKEDKRIMILTAFFAFTFNVDVDKAIRKE